MFMLPFPLTLFILFAPFVALWVIAHKNGWIEEDDGMDDEADVFFVKHDEDDRNDPGSAAYIRYH